ncbi:MAG: thioredoxin domain-containing protein [Caldilineales bacterium]|nr:thioredoxin domain-containing protein [Caldilineales bacterium]MDW8318431.1 thioredoxin domain-containing protein [Anaerolineae bacterium]
MSTAHAQPNRLIHETSPYLRQHAYNPVDWYPWGEEALAKARAEDKPIFLSIGYSACHWCHVMAHESFEDEETARLMNELFVNVKVDREERPDLDGIYMQAVQAMTGQGGWPMSVWLLPDGTPFYGGTYFPPTDRHGLPSFRRVMLAVADAYRHRRDQLLASAGRLREALQRSSLLGTAEGSLDALVADEAFSGMASQYDPVHGGFGGAPKFPQPMNLSFLLRYHWRTGDPDALAIVAHTLRRMARGGMYDQLGGGFHRYSVDDHWLVPHFEKMLYDNAQLARLYVEAWQVTGDLEFRRVAEETLDYLAREMTDPSGAFYSSQDADSEGEEGKFFLWELRELEELLGAEDARLVAAYYGVSRWGNFEGKNILHVPYDLETAARRAGVSPERMRAALERGRPILFAARERRIKPGRDDKALAEWNGLALRAFAYAAAALRRDDYRQIAERNAQFILREMIADDRSPFTAPPRLYRTWAPPSLTGGRPEAKLNAYLEDYANVADGLIELYQLTFDPRWLQAARNLAEAMLERFWDGDRGGFFQTSHDHEALIARPKEVVDNAVPSGNSAAAEVLLRLHAFTGEERYHAHAEAVLLMLRQGMVRMPLGFGHLLCVLERYLARPQEVAIVGDPAHPRTGDMLTVVRNRFRPHVAVAAAPSDQAAAEAAAVVPLLAGRTALGGQPTAYVCQGFVCQMPVTDPQALAAQLA